MSFARLSSRMYLSTGAVSFNRPLAYFLFLSLSPSFSLSLLLASNRLAFFMCNNPSYSIFPKPLLSNLFLLPSHSHLRFVGAVLLSQATSFPLPIFPCPILELGSCANFRRNGGNEWRMLQSAVEIPASKRGRERERAKHRAI